MTCPLCAFDFPLLENGSICSKCRAREPGLSVAELQVINAKPQCVGCGLQSNSFKNPICNGCIAKLKQQKDIPSKLLQVRGVASLLFETSSLAASILESASTHQHNASDFRLGHPKTDMRSTSSSTSGKFANLSKAAMVAAERKAKKLETKTKDDGGVKIAATIWMLDGKKCEQVAQIRVTKVYTLETSMKVALDALLVRAQAEFEGRYPQATQLSWSNISLHAHESNTKSSSLQHLDRRGSVGDLYNEFKNGRLMGATALNSRTIEVRFVCNRDEIHPQDDDDLGFAIIPKSSALPSKKRARAESSSNLVSHFNQRNQSSQQSRRRQASPSPEQLILTSKAPIILQSAFRPPSKKKMWTHDPPMGSFQFLCTSAECQPDGQVKFSEATETEKIELSLDWQKGEDVIANPGSFSDETGFIGRGFTKRGIYARFQDQEYVVMQPIDDYLSDSEVHTILKAEYELLSQCDGFKARFDSHAETCQVRTIPSFYFNFKSSIFGKLEPSLSSGSRTVPHKYFLATRLLPCGKADGKLKKFTGNGEIGSATDDLTKAIHAFAHFSLIYSHCHLLFCDLQGAYDFNGKMCLIDPQAHTNTPKEDRAAYWDGGPQKIQDFRDQHARDCNENWVCQRLSLHNVHVVAKGDAVGDEHSGAGEPEKHGLNFILNSRLP